MSGLFIDLIELCAAFDLIVLATATLIWTVKNAPRPSRSLDALARDAMIFYLRYPATGCMYAAGISAWLWLMPRKVRAPWTLPPGARDRGPARVTTTPLTGPGPSLEDA